MMGTEEGTKRTRSESAVSTDAQQSHLAEDIVEEILLRLPAKSLLRCRAVCRAWRRVASAPRFLAAHARLRPAEPVLYTYLDAPRCDNRPRYDDAVDIALDVLPVDNGGEEACRRLIRYPKLWTTATTTTTTSRFIAIADVEGGQHRSKDMALHCLLLASCDGVLLFKKARGLYLLCNPVTRQWAELPRLDLQQLDPGHDVEFAFYFHQRSGEYRLLCNHFTPSGTTAWCVLSTGAAEPRLVDTHAEEDGFVVPSCLRTAASAPAALHGRLHWAPRLDMFNGDKITCTKVVTFDTLSEKFHTMTGPPTTTSTLLKLFVTDGVIVVADFEKTTHVDLWFLEDYGAEKWERRHQVAMPWGGLDAFSGNFRPPEVAQGDDQGNVVLRGHGGLVVYNVRRKKTVRAVRGSKVLMSRHGFRESLVQHPSFVDVPVTADFPLVHFWY
ncbi:hypothetical protein EJB05_56704, partial [Eragrostis curvula]